MTQNINVYAQVQHAKTTWLKIMCNILLGSARMKISNMHLKGKSCVIFGVRHLLIQWAQGSNLSERHVVTYLPT